MNPARGILQALAGLLFLLAFALVLVPGIFAAAPDGAGPWADAVVSSNQGLMKNGAAVPAVRSDPTAALGVAENDTIDSHFFSLGFGGTITLHFDNPLSNGVIVVEATNPAYPLEKASVDLSADGTTWLTAGTVTQDGTVAMPESLSCARYVRITDISNSGDFPDDIADGYDVDGVQATQGEPCETPTPTPTPKPDTCADDIVISGNGAGSTNIVTSTTVRGVILQQITKTSLSETIKAKAKTGKNKLRNNTGTGGSVKTGNATVKVISTVTGGSNTGTLPSCCACENTCSTENSLQLQ